MCVLMNMSTSSNTFGPTVLPYLQAKDFCWKYDYLWSEACGSHQAPSCPSVCTRVGPRCALWCGKTPASWIRWEKRGFCWLKADLWHAYNSLLIQHVSSFCFPPLDFAVTLSDSLSSLNRITWVYTRVCSVTEGSWVCAGCVVAHYFACAGLRLKLWCGLCESAFVKLVKGKGEFAGSFSDYNCRCIFCLLFLFYHWIF